MPLTTRVWSAGKLLLLIGALLTTYVLSAALAARIALRVREVKVPALVGKPLSSGQRRGGRDRPEPEGGRQPAGRSRRLPRAGSPSRIRRPARSRDGAARSRSG